jgi:hypothetical protein
MTFEEAEKIFKSWQGYMEIVDKLGKIFIQLPESFLPYPSDILEEALNIVAKDFFDNGNKKMSNTIQETMSGYLTMHTDDEVALASMHHSLELMSKHPKLKETYLETLKECQDFWLKKK